MDTINYQYNDYDWRNGVTLYDGTDSITYDYCGNPTSYRGYTMTWAKGKQLSTMTNSEQTLTFKYDANGIRTKKNVNNVEYEYTYVGDKLIRVESNKPYDYPLTIYYTADGKPYSFYYGGGPFYYMLNLQGDVIGIATGNGNVIAEYAYDSWGKPISVTVNNSIYEDVALANPLRYRGYVYDNETGLYYLQSRYYDPELCRFISADAYLIAGNYLQGTNMFAYCLNNPVRYSDPSGCSGTESGILAANIITILVLGSCLYEELFNSNDEAFMDFWNQINFGSASEIANILVSIYSLYLENDNFSLYSALKSLGAIPPDHPDFKPPKGGNRKVKNPNGSGYGWEAKDGGVWVWTPKMHGDPGWTIQYPDGSHNHAYPGGGRRMHVSLGYSLIPVALFGVKTIVTVALLADNMTGVGLADDYLIPVIWATV